MNDNFDFDWFFNDELNDHLLTIEEYWDMTLMPSEDIVESKKEFYKSMRFVANYIEQALEAYISRFEISDEIASVMRKYLDDDIESLIIRYVYDNDDFGFHLNKNFVDIYIEAERLCISNKEA